MLSFLKDTNKWVKISAYKSLGPFIHTMKGLKMNERLLIEFSRMVDNDVNSIGKDNQIFYSCAYNFPAVLDAVGKERWEAQLWKVYEKSTKKVYAMKQMQKVKIISKRSVHSVLN